MRPRTWAEPSWVGRPRELAAIIEELREYESEAAALVGAARADAARLRAEANGRIREIRATVPEACATAGAEAATHQRQEFESSISEVQSEAHREIERLRGRRRRGSAGSWPRWSPVCGPRPTPRRWGPASGRPHECGLGRRRDPEPFHGGSRCGSGGLVLATVRGPISSRASCARVTGPGSSSPLRAQRLAATARRWWCGTCGCSPAGYRPPRSIRCGPSWAGSRSRTSRPICGAWRRARRRLRSTWVDWRSPGRPCARARLPTTSVLRCGRRPGVTREGPTRSRCPLGWGFPGARRVCGPCPVPRRGARRCCLGVARERLVFDRELSKAAARDVDRLLGRSWRKASSLGALVEVVGPEAAWVFADVSDPADLWRGERAWWARVEADAATMLDAPRPTRSGGGCRGHDAGRSASCARRDPRLRAEGRRWSRSSMPWRERLTPARTAPSGDRRAPGRGRARYWCTPQTAVPSSPTRPQGTGSPLAPRSSLVEKLGSPEAVVCPERGTGRDRCGGSPPGHRARGR